MRKPPVVVVFLFLLPGPPAAATRLLPLTVRQLTLRADWVILGRIRRTESVWVGRKIVTRNLVEVSQVWKGRRVGRLAFYTLGGRVGRYTMRVIGSPRFSPGQEVVLFLAQRHRRLFVAGMVQGAFQVVRKAGQILAIRRLGAASWAGRPPRSLWALDRLRSQVAAVAGRRAR